MSTTPINEAGITATFAAIFARLEELHGRIAALETDVERIQEARATDTGLMSALFTRLTALESARIATPVAPESAETASEVPMEPGNATRQICGVCDGIGGDCPVCVTSDPEVAAALRMYRKVQGCRTAPNGDVIRPGAGNVLTAHILLAWLKEGEA